MFGGDGRRRRSRLLAGLVVLLCASVASARVEVASAAGAPVVTQDVRVAAGSDDAEERAGGAVSLTSTDLELVFDGSNQTVGMRFNGVAIPQAAQILNAYVQFKVDETNTEATSLTIHGQATDSAATFVSSSRNISSRQRTTASAGWSPAAWTTLNPVGPDQRTPSLAAVVQEIVNRPGWTSGNSLALIVTGAGHRTARAHNGEPGGAALLHVEYESPASTAPTVTLTEPHDLTTFTPGNAITFTGTAADAQDGDLTSSLTWTSNLNGAIGTGGTFSLSNLSVGMHNITARVFDSEGLTASSSVVISVVQNTNVLIGAGDIASCESTGDEATANLLDSRAGSVYTLGDNVYPNGTAAEFANCYQQTWGRHKARTHPAPGNHDYNTPGATGYYGYFGSAAGDPTKGYYSYDLSGWHIVVLNSEIDVSTGSSQEQWLRGDLTTHPAACTLALFHKPRFSSGTVHGSNTLMAPLWDALHDQGADIVLNGHEHNYERFGLQNPNGIADPTHGIRQFVVGTGGISQTSYQFGVPLPNSEVRNNDTHGLLKLTLLPASYEWEFIPVAGKTFMDAGSGNCVQPVTAPPTNSPPVVDAGADQTIALPNTASLSGTVSDDGLPNPPTAATATWTKTTGPGTVTFTDPNATTTTATFSTDGTYTLRLTATDSALTTTDELTVTVTVDASPPPGGVRRESASTIVNSTATSVVTLAKPAGTAAGDVLVACLSLNGGSVSSTGVPSGWMRIAAVTAIANPHVFGYYKVVGSLEPASYAWTLASSVANGAGMARYSGVSNTSPLDATASIATGASSTSGAAAGVITGTANAMLVGCMAINSSNTAVTIASPAGMTQAWDIGGKRHEFADGLQSTPGASGPKAWTSSAGREWAGWLTALRPR